MRLRPGRTGLHSSRVAKAPGRHVSQRVNDLRTRGFVALEALPPPKELAGRPAEERYEVLDDLRVELYAVTALIADLIVRHAYDARAGYPPYGLGKSMFATWGMLKVHPEPYEEGSITTYLDLWKGFVDTTVLHLHRQLGELKHSKRAWLIERIDALLPLFRTIADRRMAARFADTQTFLYGGMQFGASVCVQMVEAMSRRLRHAGVPPDEQRGVLARSTAAPLRLAAMSQEHALEIYGSLLSQGGDTPSEGRTRPGWMDAERFAVVERDGAPRSVSLPIDEVEVETAAAFTTLGCPARIAIRGEEAPITVLWRWCVDVAYETGLLAGEQ